MEDNIQFSEEQAATLAVAPEPDGPQKVTFYCAVEGRPSNQQIPCGGHREKDGAGRIVAAPFRVLAFVEGILRLDADDEDGIRILRKLAKDKATGITEDREAYLDKVIPPERQVKRLEQQLAESRESENRLREQLRKGGAIRGEQAKVSEGAINTGAVPRRRQ